MVRASSSRDAGSPLHRATDDVFGTLPLWPWSAIAVIVTGGIVGALTASSLAPRDGLPHPALRWAACAGYGIVTAALITILSRAGRLLGLRASLSRRPPDDGGERPWWPLRLLAAALRGTPATRRTQQDFTAAVDRAGPEARAILAHRLWPALVTAFVAPVLGLLSAWEAGKQIDTVPGETAGEVLMRFVPQVSPPMVATIAASLALMTCLAVLDQWTKGLLQRWATTMRLTDGETETVKRLLDEQVPRKGPEAKGDTQPRVITDQPPPTPEPPPVVTVDDLESLGEAFSNRGKGI